MAVRAPGPGLAVKGVPLQDAAVRAPGEVVQVRDGGPDQVAQFFMLEGGRRRGRFEVRVQAEAEGAAGVGLPGQAGQHLRGQTRRQAAEVGLRQLDSSCEERRVRHLSEIPTP